MTLMLLAGGTYVFEVPLEGSLPLRLRAAMLLIAANLALGLVVSTWPHAAAGHADVVLLPAAQHPACRASCSRSRACRGPAQILAQALPLTHYLRIVREEFVVIRLVVRELLVSSPRAPALLARFSRGHIPMLLEAVGRAYAQGEVRPEVHPLATVLAVAATGLGVHVAARLLSEAFPAAAMPPEASGLGPSLRDLLFHGLAPRTPAHDPEAP
jgi:hypothetical protein